MKLEDAIQIISQKTGKTVEVVKAEYTEIFTKMKELTPTESDEIITEIATNNLFRSYRKKMNASGDEFAGIFTSIGGRFDMIKKRREALQEQVNKDTEQAIKENMVNDKGELLYWETPEVIKKMIGWQKEKYDKIKGTPLPMTDFKRTIFGAVMINGKPIKFEMRLRGNNSTVTPELFKKSTFRAYKIEQTSTVDNYILNDSGDFTPIYTEELSEQEVMGLFTTLYKDRMITSNEIDAFNAAHNDEFSPIAIMKVDVVDISTNTTKTGSKIMSVADDYIPLDEVMVCWIPENFKFDFMENATIYLLGTPKKDDKEKISIGVSGMFVPQQYKKQVPTTPSVETDKW